MHTRFHRSIELFLAILLTFSLLGPARDAGATPLVVPTCVWTGAVSTFWSNTGNWTSLPSPAPTCPNLADGTTVVLAFPTAALHKSNNNDVANLHVAGMGFQSGGYTLDGNPISLSDNIINAGGINYVSLPIQLTINIAADITGSLHLGGAISGAFNIAKLSSGTLFLDSANTFSGGVTITAGQVTLSQAQAGGSGTLWAQAGATLAVANAVTTLANPLTLSGAGVGGSGALHFEGAQLYLSGPVTLAAATTIQSTAGTLTLSNAIGGAGDLTLDGPNFTLAGSSANTFNGKLIVPHGVLALNHSAGVTAVPGNLDVGNGVNPAAVNAKADNQLSSASRLNMAKYAVFNLEGHSQTVAGIVAWDRPCQIILGGDQNVTLTFNTTSGPQNYVNCDVTGTGKLLVKGSGMQSFENNDPAAPFYGTLEVQEQSASYLSAFQSNGPYYLHGAGTAGGFYPGTKVGSLVAENAWIAIEMPDPASASQAGSVLLSGSDTNFELMTFNAFGLKVPGAVDLGSAQLDVCYFFDETDNPYVPDLADTPANPKRRTLIQKDAAGPVTGTFSGLPEGAQVSLSYCFGGTNPTYPLRLTYQGGDGNDVVVTRLAQDSLTLMMVPSSPGINQAVQLVATLVPLETAYGATPSKKVAFYDGNTLLGEASFTGLTASMSAGPFLGTHSIQARLVGDPSFVDATSNNVTFRVGRLLFVPLLKK